MKMYTHVKMCILTVSVTLEFIVSCFIDFPLMDNSNGVFRQSIVSYPSSPSHPSSSTHWPILHVILLRRRAEVTLWTIDFHCDCVCVPGDRLCAGERQPL